MGMKNRLLGIQHSNGGRRTTTENCPCRESQPNDLSYGVLAKLIVKTVQFGPAEPFFPSLWCICRGDEQSQRRALFWPLGKETMEYDFMINNPIPKLRKAPQPPLAHPRATPDSDRAKRPPLAEPSATDQELNPGDRVEGLGNFGKPTGELGTVEQANEDDAVVKWDDDGRMRLSQPWLKKV
jgi:hypothetical protein